MTTEPSGQKTRHMALYRLAPMLAAGFVAAYIDRVNISFAQDALGQSAGLTTEAFGFGAGLFFAGYVLAEIPANIMLVGIGARRWLAAILITWGLLSGLTIVVSSPLQFSMLRFALGVAEAGFFPGALHYLGQWVPPGGRAKVSAVLLLAIPVAGLLGGMLSGGIMAGFDGWLGLAGWRWLFLIEAVAPVLLGILCLKGLPDAPAGEEGREAPRAQWRAVGGALRDPAVWHIALLDGANLLSLYLVTFWLPYALGRHGVTAPVAVGFLSAIPSALAIVCMMLNGWDSDRRNERRHHIAIPMAVGAGALMASGFTSSLWLFVMLISLGNAGLLAAIPAYWTIPGSLRGGREPAVTIAVASSIANVAGMGSTMLAGYIINSSGGVRMAFLIMPLATILAALSAYRIARGTAVQPVGEYRGGGR